MSEAARLLGLDYGEKRTGVALSDPLGIVASPHTTLNSTSSRGLVEALAALVDNHQISKIVVGLPTDSEGNVGHQAQRVIGWARKVAQMVDVPVVFWDETYSTEEAAALTRRGKGRHDLDAVAAAVILQSYLEARQTSDEPGQPLQAFDDSF